MRYLDPDHRLSLNFFAWEFCVSETADAHGIEIRIVEDSPVHKNYRALAHNTLQPWREDVGPLHISSGYRPVHVNELVGGSSTSDHTGQHGAAADVWHDTLTPLELAQGLVALGAPFDQVILEHDQGVVHVGHRRPGDDGAERNRGEVKTRWRILVGHDADGTPQYRYHYAEGLHDEDDLTPE